MRMRSYIVVIVVFLSLTVGCKKVNEIDLIGHWRAIEVLEEQTPLKVDVQQIKINFKPTHYEYTSTLNYQEAGTYRIQSNLLFTKDTLKVNALEKAVEIIKVSPDSLVLRMNEKGKERLLKLVRGSEE